MYWIPLMVLQVCCVFFSWAIPSLRKIVFVFMTISMYVFLVDGYFNGIDWVNYYSGFNDYNNISEFLTGYEPLFGFLVFILKKITDDFYFSIIIYYSIILVVLCYFLSNLSNILKGNSTVLLFLLLFVNGIDLFNDQIRQLMAVAFSVGALFHLLQENRKTFYFLTFLAILSHFSAVVILCYPLILKRKRVVVLMGTIGATCIILATLCHTVILNVLPLLGGAGSIVSNKLSFYFSKFELKFGFMAAINILVISRYVLIRTYKSETERVLWNGCFLASLFHLSFYFFPILQRLNPYFNIFYCLLTSFYLYGLSKILTINRIVIYISVLLTVFSVTTGYFSDPARPTVYKSYFLDYVSGKYDINIDKIRRCNEFLSDIPFCRW